MQIVLLEYNDIHAEVAMVWIKKWLPDPNLRLVILQTEHSFREWLKSQSGIPNLVIIDPMMPWAKLGANMPKMPKEVLEGGALLSGIRCAKMLRQSAPTAQVPIIFWTTLVRRHWPAEIDLGVLVNKGEGDEPLLKAIQEALQ